ncbi:dihydropteroate synthase [Lentibacter algarum]|uniref:dihydropteroate synthase n=1 Tax=Lentibacter algarum TaxID=576131 RepID=UPI001C08E34E|nr:dihydropteroate synthase [Lentibacter algarum]MBU2983458.1 dihydropteroate synthase [Lentibacter algarum]
MSRYYYRPLVHTGSFRPDNAAQLAGGPCWFTHAEVVSRTKRGSYIPVERLPADVLQNLTSLRQPLGALSLDEARIMGILNVTPDSFSDGGRFSGAAQALAYAERMVADGADIIDIGGESTRPGATEVPHEAEIARTAPVIEAIRSKLSTPISIDTRKCTVAKAAIQHGADMVNDVSGFTFDADLAQLCAENDVPVFAMHAQGDPMTMQRNPVYRDVLLDVYDFLETQLAMLESLGIDRSRVVLDPGIGFGKTQAHNLALLNGMSVFHGLGCALLLGVSRKGFIGKIGQTPLARDRVSGSVAVGLAGLAQGVQILRVHDVAETKQAIRLWQAVARGE